MAEGNPQNSTALMPPTKWRTIIRSLLAASAILLANSPALGQSTVILHPGDPDNSLHDPLDPILFEPVTFITISDPGALGTNVAISLTFNIWDLDHSSGNPAPTQAAPSHDHFASATLLPPEPAGQSFEFRTDAATTEPGEPGLGTPSVQRTVWWRFTPATDQALRFKAIGNFGALPLEIFECSELPTRMRVAHNDSRAFIPGFEGITIFQAQAGHTYHIRVSDPRSSSPTDPFFSPLPPNRTALQLVVESMHDPLPGLVLLTTAPGAPAQDGTISWDVLARVRGLQGEIFTDVNYLAQFYLGPDLSSLTPFQTPVLIHQGTAQGDAELAGTITAGFATVPQVPSGQSLCVQIRVWDGRAGATYEAARANGANIARSKPIQVQTGSELTGPANLSGIQDIHLAPGQAGFTPGTLRLAASSSGTLTWELQASPGFTHAIELLQPSGAWLPLLTLTNNLGTVTFTDPRESPAPHAIYRARLLD